MRDILYNFNDFLYNLIVFLFVHNWPLTLVVTLGTATLYVLLPRPRRFYWLLGVVLAICFVSLAGWFFLPNTYLTAENFLFYAFSFLAITGGLSLVTQSNPAHAALSFAVVVLATCGLFLLQAAPFLMAATIIIYAGAIIVTFLFVLMLAQQEGLSDADQRSREPFLAACAGFTLLGVLLYVLDQAYHPNRVLQFRSAIQNRYDKTRELIEAGDDLRRLLASVQEVDVKDSIKAFVNRVEKHKKSFERWITDPLTQESEDQEKPEEDRRKREEKEREEKLRWQELGWPEEWRASFKAALLNLDDAIGNARGALDAIANAGRPLEELPTVFGVLLDSLEQVRTAIFLVVHSGGGLQPSAKELSELSGPRPSQLLNLRRDEQGRPVLPAENTAFLGKSLFSDYLLAVELAGILLLVATIGAIAIAYRRREERTT